MEYIGFDPGGKGAFGWCVASFNSDVPTCVGGVTNDASAALEAAKRALEGRPAAIGIDAPLFWIASGDRIADSKVRDLVIAAGGHGATVGHVNSLRGACLVQGVLIARLAANAWPDAAITEAHPKALHKVCKAAKTFGERPELAGPGDHLRDAALAAFAAHAFATSASGWHDLAALEQAPFFPGGARVQYWFPKQQM